MAENNETQEETRDPEALGFIAGVSTENAKRALQAADDVDMAQWRVRVVNGGFEAPNAIVDRYQELLEADWKPEEESDATPRGLTDQSLNEAETAAKLAEARKQTEESGETIAGLPSAPLDGSVSDPSASSNVEDADSGQEVDPNEPADNADWTVERLNDYIDQHELEVDKSLKKSDKVAAILAARNTKE